VGGGYEDEEGGMNYEEKAVRVYDNMYAIQLPPADDRYRHDVGLIEKALQEAHDAGLEEAASKSEAFGLLSDCRCDRHERIAKAIRALKSKGGE
jgi:hypothetical protein